MSAPDVSKALAVAVAAIYFDDSSDFGGALWDVVRALDPAMAELLERDESEAYDRTHPSPETSR